MIKAIFAIDAFGGMGWQGDLPWPSCKEDFKWFKDNTENTTVIMGRKTWEGKGMPKPLPNRHNIVVSKNPRYKAYRADVWGENWIERMRNLAEVSPKDVWIIGGPALLQEAKPWIKEHYVTRFKTGYRSDVKLDTRSYFEDLRCRTVRPSQEGNQLTFEIFIPWSNT
jgi:dihydrofolate reductase